MFFRENIVKDAAALINSLQPNFETGFIKKACGSKAVLQRTCVERTYFLASLFFGSLFLQERNRIRSNAFFLA